MNCIGEYHIWSVALDERAIGQPCQCGQMVWTMNGARLKEWANAPGGLTMAEAVANGRIALALVMMPFMLLGCWLLDRIVSLRE